MFIGHTRFSLYNPGSGAWLASNNSRFNSEDEYKDYLFSDGRLDLRFEIFIGHSLPILAAGSVGFGYFHVVSYSDTLPLKYEERLIDAAQRFPFLVLNKYIEGACKSNTHHLAHKLYSSADGIWRRGAAMGMFRLDDDDLVTVNFFRDMARYLNTENVGSRVSLGRGVSALYRDGKYEHFREVYKPMIAIGLLDIGTVSHEGKLILPPDVPHHLSDRHGPVIVDSRNLSFMWTRHDSQDTALSYGDTDRTLDDMNRYPELGEGIELAALFPSPALNF